MPVVNIQNAGRLGLNQDLSQHELPMDVWTDVYNIRFLDGYASLVLGEGQYFGVPSVTPLHVVPVDVFGKSHWLYASANKIYTAYINAGVPTHVNLTRQVSLVDQDYSATKNAWTSTTVSGIPILNPGNEIDPPQSWDLNLSNRFVNLPAWPANTFCKALRGYKNFLVALNVTRNSVNYPYMVKWSHPADPGSIPISWATNDPTVDAGEQDIGQGYGAIVDGGQLQDSFIIYKEDSIWRMDLIGGQQVFNFKKIIGDSGALNRNCIVEFKGMHLVLTNSDIIVNDGMNPISILDKISRRWLFRNIDVDGIDNCFVFKNTFFNEIYICYPEVSSLIPNRAIVWNYKDQTVSHREMPEVLHGAYGPIDKEYADTWEADEDPWDVDDTAWDGPGIVPPQARVMLGCNDLKIKLLDSFYSHENAVRSGYLERRGLSLNNPDKIKLVRSIRPRIVGQTGQTIKISVGSQSDPWEEPVWTTSVYTVGVSVLSHFLVSGRFIAVKFESDSAYKWRLDSYDVDFEFIGEW